MQAHPVLYQSIREINCCNMVHKSPREQLFYNFKLGGRGSIRKPPNLIDWTLSLRHLAARAGEKDTGNVVRMWNSQCPVSQQIVGRKAMALKSLMEQMPEDALTLLVTMVSEMGWEESPWTEDALASKRILPGYVFRVADSKAWSARQTVSRQSVVLMVERMRQDVAKKNLRGKLTEKQVSERAQSAAVIYNVLNEVKTLVSMPLSDLDKWLGDWLEGDAGLDMELRSVIMQRDEKFHPRDMPSLRDLFEQHGGRALGGNQVQQCSEKVRVQATELEETMFALVQKQVAYDKDAFLCHLSRLSNVEKAIYHKKMEWKVQAHRQSQQAVEHWWERNVTLINAMHPEPYLGFKMVAMELSKRHSVPADRVVPPARNIHEERQWLCGTFDVGACNHLGLGLGDGAITLCRSRCRLSW